MAAVVDVDEGAGAATAVAVEVADRFQDPSPMALSWDVDVRGVACRALFEAPVSYGFGLTLTSNSLVVMDTTTLLSIKLVCE